MPATVTNIKTKRGLAPPKATNGKAKKAKKANAKKANGKAAQTRAAKTAGLDRRSETIKSYVRKVESLQFEKAEAMEPLREDAKQITAGMKDDGIDPVAVRELCRRRAFKRDRGLKAALVDQYSLVFTD